MAVGGVAGPFIVTQFRIALRRVEYQYSVRPSRGRVLATRESRKVPRPQPNLDKIPTAVVVPHICPFKL